VTALVQLRLRALLRGKVGLLPAVALILIVALIVSGVRSTPAQAYTVSVAMLFPVIAIQTTMLLDSEPAIHTDLVILALGSRPREIVAGLLAAALAALATVLAVLVVPWLVGGIRPTPQAATVGLLLGAAAHLAVVVPAITLGAAASRLVTGDPMKSVGVLFAGVIVTYAFGRRDLSVEWLVPPVLATLRVLTDPSPSAALAVAARALCWSAVALAGYAAIRLRRWR
jgi:hypothetical protein